MPGIKKFIVPCDFNGQSSPFAIYIGEPKPENHPVQHQDNWLSKERGGTIPEKIKDSLSKLYALAQKWYLFCRSMCICFNSCCTQKF